MEVTFMHMYEHLNTPYFHFTWVLKLLTSHKYQLQPSCTHYHAHLLMSFNGHGSWPIIACADRKESFIDPIPTKEERNHPPSANQGLFTTKSRRSHVISACIRNLPTSPCPTHSAGTEPKS